MDQSNQNTYTTLADVTVTDKLEQKGQFTYLSWPHALDRLLRKYPAAEIVEHLHDTASGKSPVLATPHGNFVQVSVTLEGVTRSKVHPITDNRNAPIDNPDAQEVNTALMRCMVKAIAMHGLGLAVYAGEDLPEVDGEVVQAKQQPQAVKVEQPEDPADWQQAIVPIGKNKDKKLAELADRSLQWYAEHYTANTDYPDSVAFRAACDAMAKEKGWATPEEEAPPPEPVQEQEDDSEEVPF